MSIIYYFGMHDVTPDGHFTTFSKNSNFESVGCRILHVLQILNLDLHWVEITLSN